MKTLYNFLNFYEIMIFIMFLENKPNIHFCIFDYFKNNQMRCLILCRLLVRAFPHTDELHYLEYKV